MTATNMCSNLFKFSQVRQSKEVTFVDVNWSCVLHKATCHSFNSFSYCNSVLLSSDKICL